MRICLEQLPDTRAVAATVQSVGGTLITVNDRAVVVAGFNEQHRYWIQHSLGYQVHDVTKPHYRYRHGRADLGWPTFSQEGSTA